MFDATLKNRTVVLDSCSGLWESALKGHIPWYPLARTPYFAGRLREVQNILNAILDEAIWHSGATQQFLMLWD